MPLTSQIGGGSGGSSAASDATLTTSDITTNNVSTAKHGFAPKAPNDATKYLDGTGAYSTPAGGSPPFSDATAIVKGAADGTKAILISATNVTTGTTRTWTAPNSDTSIPICAQILTWAGPTAARTFTLPDANATLARKDAAQTFTGLQSFATGIAITANGAATTPSTKIGTTGAGFWSRSGSEINFAVGGTNDGGEINASLGILLTTVLPVVGWTGSASSGSGNRTGISEVTTGVIGAGTGGAASVAGWFADASHVTLSADVTNVTTTFANMTDLSRTLIAGRKYTGELVIKCNNSIATEGIKIDFNGGSATMTSFWAAGNQFVGGTDVLGTGISTSLAGVINFSTITGETLIVIKLFIKVNAGGTFIPRFAENSSATGTATVELGSFLAIPDSN